MIPAEVILASYPDKCERSDENKFLLQTSTGVSS